MISIAASNPRLSTEAAYKNVSRVDWQSQIPPNFSNLKEMFYNGDLKTAQILIAHFLLKKCYSRDANPTHQEPKSFKNWTF